MAILGGESQRAWDVVEIPAFLLAVGDSRGAPGSGLERGRRLSMGFFVRLGQMLAASTLLEHTIFPT